MHEDSETDDLVDPQKALQLCKRLVLPKPGREPDKEIAHCIDVCNEYKRNINPPYRGVVADLNQLKKEEQYLTRFGCELLGATELFMAEHRSMIRNVLTNKLPLPVPKKLPAKEYSEKLKSNLAIYASAFCYEIDSQQKQLDDLRKATITALFERKLMKALIQKQEDLVFGRPVKAFDPKQLALEAYKEICGVESS